MWTDQRIELLTSLWTDGKPCSLIAAEISRDGHGPISRNAIIGKVHRLGLPMRGQAEKNRNRTISASPPRSRPRKRASPQRFNGKPAHDFSPPPVALNAPTIRRIPFFDLTFTDGAPAECRYPLDEGRLYCGGKPQAGSSYCPYHNRICNVPLPSRRRDRLGYYAARITGENRGETAENQNQA